MTDEFYKVCSIRLENQGRFLCSPLVDRVQSTYFLKDDLLSLKLFLIFIHNLLKSSTSALTSRLVSDQTSGYYNA